MPISIPENKVFVQVNYPGKLSGVCGLYLWAKDESGQGNPSISEFLKRIELREFDKPLSWEPLAKAWPSSICKATAAPMP